MVAVVVGVAVVVAVVVGVVVGVAVVVVVVVGVAVVVVVVVGVAVGVGVAVVVGVGVVVAVGVAVGVAVAVAVAVGVGMTAKPSKTPYKASESQEQCCVVDWWRIACKGYSLPEFALYAVPNGANKSISQAVKFKREGLRKGIPDLCMDVPSGGYHGLRIEMKVKPHKPSPEQKAVMVYLAKADYRVCLCYSAQEAINDIKAYLHD